MSQNEIKLEPESFKNFEGSVNIRLIDADGNVKQEHTNHNLIVTVGKTFLATYLTPSGHGANFFDYMALGTGSTSPVSGDTALQTELSGGGYSRQVGVVTSSSNVWQNVCTFSPGNGTAAITEAGLFSAATVGTMFARQVFSVYNKAAGDTLIITWTITLS